MEKRGFFAVIYFFITATTCLADWTWNFSKQLSVAESRKNTNEFSKKGTPAFTQLIFCWNAYRPKVGYYTFSVQTRNAITKEWMPTWIKMMEWGADIQRSYHVNKVSGVNYVYVRLEQNDPSKADAFRIKVECVDGASLADFRLMNVCISDISKFEQEDLVSLNNLQSVELKGIPKISQFELGHDNQDAMCSPTSLTMFLDYLRKRQVDPLAVASCCYDNGLKVYGSWPFNIACAFERCPTYNFRVKRLHSFKDLHSYLMRGIPVQVSIRGSLKSAPQDYPGGHLIIVSGYDSKKQNVIVYDPAFKASTKVKHKYSLSDFLRAWDRSHRLAYVADPVER